MTRPIRTLSVAALCALTVGFVSAQDWAKTKLAASPRHGEYVTITEPDGRALQAWVVYPEVKGKAPVVVMIHEIFGLTDWAKLMADEVAAKGYIVVEPDLLSGFGAPPTTGAAVSDGMAGMDHMHMTPAGSGAVVAMPGGTSAFPDQGSAVKAVSGLNAALVMTDLDAAADYGKKLPAANGKLASAGFCWGGGKSFAFAVHRKDLNKAFVFYGPPPAQDELKTINASVYGFYGEMDARISATVDATRAQMKAAGKKYVAVVYAGAGHGFMRSGQAPESKPADAKAWDEGFEKMQAELAKLK